MGKEGNVGIAKLFVISFPYMTFSEIKFWGKKSKSNLV